MKTIVETELKLDNGTKRKYVGRFLGFVTDEEYRKIVGNPEISSRIETKPTKRLIDCCEKANEKNWGLQNIRFVLVLKKSDDKAILNRLLLVSSKLTYISEIKPESKEVMFVTSKGEFISMKEREAGAE